MQASKFACVFEQIKKFKKTVHGFFVRLFLEWPFFDSPILKQALFGANHYCANFLCDLPEYSRLFVLAFAVFFTLLPTGTVSQSLFMCTKPINCCSTSKITASGAGGMEFKS